jgi:hypothetical protein
VFARTSAEPENFSGKRTSEAEAAPKREFGGDLWLNHAGYLRIPSFRNCLSRRVGLGIFPGITGLA